MFTVNQGKAVEEAPGYRRMFGTGRLTLGVFFPIEAFSGDMPSMSNQEALARRSEALGFSALWFRDVPLRDPGFGDVGQIYDPWVYLGHIAAQTSEIALATGSIVLTLRHPLNVAKAAASVDQLSNGRLILGVGSGDRPAEFAAYGKRIEDRARQFQESLIVIRSVLEDNFPEFTSSYGAFQGVDLVPKPTHRSIPIFVTGFSGQNLEWIARNSDGWITYPRDPSRQAVAARMWTEAVQRVSPGQWKPFVQSLYIDLVDDPEAAPTPIHLGFRTGRLALIETLEEFEGLGVSHVALNLKYGRRPAMAVLQEISEFVLPSFRRARVQKAAHRSI